MFSLITKSRIYRLGSVTMNELNVPSNEFNSKFTKPSASLWSSTAIAAPKTGALADDVCSDVVVVGAGITGLSTAIHLAELGHQVVVLEAGELGAAASGLNGGQVIPGLKHSPRKLVKMYGDTLGGEIARASQASANYTFDFIERLNIQCEARQGGWIKACHDQKSLNEALADAQDLMLHDAPIEILNAQQIQEKIGSDKFIGGYLDKRAGSVQPLSYTRELCRVALSLGVKVYTQSGVERLYERTAVPAHEYSWQVNTALGSIKTNHVVLATNAKTGDLWPKLKKTVFPMNSFQIATKPLSKELLAEILPQGHVVSDSHRMLSYFRTDSHGRLILGGEGGLKDVPTLKDAAGIKKSINRFFPQLKDIESEFIWSGQVAVTADYMPRLSNPAPGLYCAVGFNGRGVAMATLMGNYLAKLIRGSGAEDIPFPITDINPVPLHCFYKLGAAAVMAGMRVQDHLEDARMDKIWAKNG